MPVRARPGLASGLQQLEAMSPIKEAAIFALGLTLTVLGALLIIEPELLTMML